MNEGRVAAVGGVVMNAPAAPAAPRPTAPVGLHARAPSAVALGLYVPATVLIRVINFGRVIVLTWFMSRQQFGLLNILLTVINVLTPLASLGLNEAVTRYVPQFEARGALAAFLQRTMLMLAVLVSLFGAALLLVAPLLGTRFFGQMVYDPAIRRIVVAQLGDLTRLSAFIVALLAFYFFLLAVLKGLRMIKALTLAELVHSVIFLWLALLAILRGHRSAKTITACYAVSLAAALLVSGGALLSAVRRWKCQHAAIEDPRLARRLARFSVWAMISGVTWQVLQVYPQWYLNKVMGNDAVAIFSAVRQIGQFVLLGAITLVTVVMTTVTKTWETRGVAAADRQLSLAFRGAGALLLLGCAALALARGQIVRVFHPGYAPGAEILPLQLLFFVIGADFAFIALHFNLIEKPRLHFLPYAIGVAANILLAFWFVGPRLETLRSAPLWRAIADPLGGLVSVGLSDSLRLGGAAWSGALAMVCAMVACLAILRAEGRRLDRGSYIVLASSLLLAAHPAILLTGSIAFVVLCLFTSVVFTPAERNELVAHAESAAGSLFGRAARVRDGHA